VQYALSPYIKQTRLVFKWLMDCHKFLSFAVVYLTEASIFLGFDSISLGKCFPTFQDDTVISSSQVEMSKKNAIEHFNPSS
jgi:hypothetical protein